MDKLWICSRNQNARCTLSLKRTNLTFAIFETWNVFDRNEEISMKFSSVIVIEVYNNRKKIEVA